MTESPIQRNTLDELVSTTDAAFVSELIDTFLDDAPSLLDSLRSTLASQDAEGFRRAAHSLKSNAATLGATALSASAKELEMVGKSGDLSGVGPRIDELQDEFLGVKQALKDYQNEP
jgi:histidine phosphotransfer protein HptB